MFAINRAIAFKVKSKLTQSDVDEYLDRLAKFKGFFPPYQDVNLLGAVGEWLCFRIRLVMPVPMVKVCL